MGKVDYSTIALPSLIKIYLPIIYTPICCSDTACSPYPLPPFTHTDKDEEKQVKGSHVFLHMPIPKMDSSMDMQP